MGRIVGWVVLGLGLAVRLPAQTAEPDSGKAAVARWLGLVAGGAAADAWNQASPLFRYRITETVWREWVAANAAQLSGAGPRRQVEFTTGHDEPPLEPLDWIRVLFAHDRPGGGRYYEQVIAIDDDGIWRVAHYAAWMDDLAMVNSGALARVPYHLAYRGQATLSDLRWRVIRRRPHPPVGPPADPPRNVANPETIRKPPPP